MHAALGATTGGASAADTLPGTVSVSKAEYIRICEATGGNPIEQSDGSVTCFFPDGSWSRCWFDTMTCQDSPGIPWPSDPIIVPPTGIVAQPDDPSGPSPAIGLDAAPVASHVAATVDEDRKHQKDKDKKKNKDGKKKRGDGKARKR